MFGCGTGTANSNSTSNSGSNTQVVAKGTRVLAMDALDGSNLSASLTAAKSAGAQSVTQLVTWTMIETSPGVYNTAVLQPAATLLPQQGMSVSLMVAVINTTVKDVPPDLANTAFDDPAFIARFEALLDQIFAALPNTQIVSVGIGNEVDAYLNTGAQWTEYQNFYNAIVAYIHAKRPGTKVGVQGTMYGITGPWKTQFVGLTQSSDVYMVSYYPLNLDYTVKDPSVVAQDVDSLMATYSDKPVEIREAGYPDSTLLNSSQSKEATFVGNMFNAWDKYASQIQYVCFTRLNDKTDAEIAADANYYHITDPNMLAFFQTIGLRAADGTEKPAFGTLRSAATSRGW